ncbi:MAG: hypothetical protein Q9204_003730 [Flavoplaca sp. TL-2023a]
MNCGKPPAPSASSSKGSMLRYFARPPLESLLSSLPSGISLESMPHLGPSNVHWLAPTTIVLALVTGFILTLGHHFFYYSLDGEPVSTESYRFVGKTIPKQQFNTSVGILFALLVRTLLSIAVSTAYVQLFWRGLRTAKQPPRLAELDWASSGVNNVLRLFNFKYWRKFSGLVALAMVFWCLPIATIFPPATLSVINAYQVPSSMLQVPQFEFASFNYAAGLIDNLSNDYLEWSGPSQAIQYMASRVMAAGQVLPITSPAPNATWTLDFWGPALQCNDVPETKRNQIFTNIWNSYNIDDPRDPASYSFLSWVPWSVSDYRENGNYTWDSSNPTSYLPFMFDFVQLHDGVHYGSINRVPKIGPASSPVSTSGPLSLFIATLPGTQKVSIMKTYPGRNPAGIREYKYIKYSPSKNGSVSGECDYRTISRVSDAFPNCTRATENIAAIAFEDATLLQCDLVNTSYLSEFQYTNGQQDIQLRPNKMHGSLVVNGSAQFYGPTEHSPEVTDCGSLRVVPPANASDDPGAPDVWKDCGYDSSALNLLSYQGIMAAFNQMILGSVQRNYDGGTDTNTTIMRTVLANTEELAFMRDWSTSHAHGDTANTLQGSTGEELLGARGALKSTLEELFLNYTISLLAEPYFQPNFSSAFAPSQFANVSLPTYQTVYSYNHSTLWIAYGLSILFSALAAIAGIVVIILGGASYSNQFSTVVRVAKTGDLDVDIVDQKSDGFGRDPLPDYLEHARLDMWGDRGNAGLDNPQAQDSNKGMSMQDVLEVRSIEDEGLVSGSGDQNAALMEQCER